VFTCQNVDFAYRHAQPVLRRFSHRFEAGTLTALVGPNGCGKTTLLRLLLGSLQPTRGEIIRSTSKPPAFIPQQSAPIFSFSLKEVVQMSGASPNGVSSAIEAVDLAPFFQRDFFSLSAGQRQRGLIARGIAQAESQANAGAALLADEPTASLDPKHAQRTLQLLHTLTRQGVTIVAVLHDLLLAAAFATHAVLLDETGRIAAAGPGQQVLAPDLIASVYGVPFTTVSAGTVSGPVASLRPMP